MYVWTDDAPAPPVVPVVPSAVTAVTADLNDEDDDEDGDDDDEPSAGLAGRAGGAGAAGAGGTPSNALPQPPPTVLPDRICKLRLIAESVVNGTKTEAPFVRRQGTDVWNVCFRIEVGRRCSAPGPPLGRGR